MAHEYQTVTNVSQPHEAENSGVLRCLPKVPIEGPFHRHGSVTPNDRSPNILLQHGAVHITVCQ